MNTTIRKFKIGDYVEHKYGSPIMRILKYKDENMVECVSYIHGRRVVESYHQTNLIKSKPIGLFKL